MESSNHPNKDLLLALAACALVFCCLVVVSLAGGIAAARVFATWLESNQGQAIPAVSSQPALPVLRPSSSVAPQQTLDALRAAVMLYDDPYDRNCRLWGYCNIAQSVAGPSRPYELGARRLFWIWDADAEQYTRSPAILRAITEHAYLWIGEAIDYQESDAVALMDAFENTIYPANRGFFGSEWSPGVDNDPRIYILYVGGLGSGIGSRYSPIDEINPRIYERSNAAELYALNADTMELGNDFTLGSLATGHQRMIQWNLDKSEAAWLESGLSELAAYVDGYDPGGSAWAYAQDPAVSLLGYADLEKTPELWSRHTGQKFLFLKYIWDRFGEDAVRDVAANPANGLESVSAVLKDRGVTDPASGKPITAEDVVLDWMLAMYLEDPGIGDGRYAFKDLPNPPRLAPNRRLDQCPNDVVYGAITQFTPEFVEITCPGESTIEFTGSTATQIVPADPHSGQYVYWSNVGDAAFSTLTGEFDLTGVSGAIEFSYWLWFDTDEDSDTLSVEVSTDGESWQYLKTASCAANDTYSTPYDCYYSGISGNEGAAGWIQDRVDLFAYAGQKVMVRFEYASSSSHASMGALLDDLELPKLQYREDFEAGESDWKSHGFAKVQNILPQTYRVALVREGIAGATVQYIDLGRNQAAKIPLTLRPWERAVVLVMAAQPYTHLPTGYQLQIMSSRTHSRTGGN